MMRIIIILFISLLSSCQLSVYKENEPDNTRNNAQQILFPLKLKGSIQNIKDTDYYQININDSLGHRLDISLYTSGPNSLQLNIYNNNNNLVKAQYLLRQQLEEGREDLVFKDIYLTNGIYYLRITPKDPQDKKNEYLLSIKENPPDLNQEKEPNDKLDQANEINLSDGDGYIKGHFNPAWNLMLAGNNYLESDYYFFKIEKTNVVMSIEISSLPCSDPVLELYNGSGQLLKKVDSLGVDEPEILKNFGVAEPGLYYLNVYTKNTVENYETPYQLYVHIQQTETGKELENNDDFSTAQMIDNQIKGYINPAMDIDFYKIHLENEKNVLNISLTPVKDLDLALDVFNNEKNKLYHLNSSSKNQSEFLPNLFLTKGDYYLSVYETGHMKQNFLDEYVLKINRIDYKNNMEYEPNDTMAQAVQINLNQTWKGYMAPKEDNDYFSINIEEQKSIKIEVSAIPLIDFIIVILDAQGQPVQEINKKKKGEGESVLVNFNPGKYYIILKDADKNSNAYENYILSIYER